MSMCSCDCAGDKKYWFIYLTCVLCIIFFCSFILSIVLGGIAELFKSSRKEERLYLSKRKGFIKYALSYGVDVIPVSLQFTY